MKFVILIVFTSMGIVLSIPGKHHYPASFENVYSTEIVSDEVTEEHKIFKKSIASLPPDFVNSVDQDETPQESQEPCRLTLPTLEDLSAVEIPQDPYSDDAVQDYLPMEVIPPRIPSFPYNIPFTKWTPYDINYLTQESAQDLIAPYNSYNIPYIYSNPVPSVRSLPPVISTHIHETFPEIPEDNEYDVDSFSDDEVYFPPYVRVVRSRDEDVLDQLAKDAVMPNILPTMPFPYMRTASVPHYQSQYNPSYQKPHQGEQMVALFPAGEGSDCALPFLVSCNLNISPGTLAQNAYGGYPVQSAPATYRKDGAVGPTVAHGKAL